MHIDNALSGRIVSRSAILPGLHLEVAIDLRAPEKRGHWSARGASFIAVHVPGDGPAPAILDCADFLADRAGAIGMVVGDAPHSAASAFFVQPDPLHGVDGPSLVRAVAEALAAVDARVGATIDQADGFDENYPPEALSEASRSIGQLLCLVESHIQSIAIAPLQK